MKSLSVLRKFIREEIGRNFHTVDNTPYTFEDFQDYNIQIDGNTSGDFFLTVYYRKEKIFPTSKFGSHEDAHHHARMVIDSDRVNRMNNEEKKE